jgi:hypothetical protein
MFLASMVLGLVGLLVMALLGMGHGHGPHGHAGHGAHGHAGGHGQVGTHGHNASGHASHVGHSHDSSLAKFLGLISPRTLFSLALGFGAVGLVTQNFLPWWLGLPVAVIGALLLETLLVYPYWNWLMGFASAPADTLDSLVRAKARAVMNFDANGSGLIRLELDGQVRQVLGTLRPDQRGLSVLTGDAVRVEAVDAQGNCVVSKLV